LRGAAARACEPLVQLEHLVGRVPAGKAEELGEIAERRARWPRAGAGAGDARLPTARPDEPGGDLDERRLAGAVRAEQPDELPLAHRQVDAAQRLHRPVALLQIANGKCVGHSATMPRGYMEGPASEEAERRAEEIERGILPEDPTPAYPAVYGCTEDDPEPHFLGWANEVDPDELF